jgi:hypothetical protein
MVTDQSCVQDPVVEDLLDIPIFNPADELQSKLALEVIETAGQKELTRDERITKVELLVQLRMAEHSNPPATMSKATLCSCLIDLR